MWIRNPLRTAKQTHRAQLVGSDLQELVVGNDVKIRDVDVTPTGSESWSWQSIPWRPKSVGRMHERHIDALRFVKEDRG